MKRTAFRLLSLMVLITSGCTKKDVAEPPASKAARILSLHIDGSYSTSQTDNWVLVHDVNGKLIDYKPFESGDVLNIETTKDIAENKVHVTFFQFSIINGYHAYDVNSYLYNDLGQEWTLKPNPRLPTPNSIAIGQFKVNVANVPAGSAYQFSNKNKILFGSGTWFAGSNVLSESYQLFDDGRDCFFYMSNNQGEIRYQFLKNINNNDVLNLDFSTMNQFDSVVRVTFPPTKKDRILYWVNSADTSKADKTSGFLTDCNLSNTYNSDNSPISELRLGYLDTFSIYNTAVNVAYDSINYGYEKFGTRPESITFPLAAKFTLNDRSVTDFNFVSSQEIQMRKSYWLYIDHTSSQPSSINWLVYAPSQRFQKLKDLPAEFAAKYPTFSLDKPQHYSSSFITQGNSYTNIINTTFKGEKPNTFYEMYTVDMK